MASWSAPNRKTAREDLPLHLPSASRPTAPRQTLEVSSFYRPSRSSPDPPRLPSVRNLEFRFLLRLQLPSGLLVRLTAYASEHAGPNGCLTRVEYCDLSSVGRGQADKSGEESCLKCPRHGSVEVSCKECVCEKECEGGWVGM